MKIDLKKHMTVEMNEDGISSFVPLTDRVSNTHLSIFKKTEDGKKILLPIWIPKVYISSASYRRIFKEIYPEGRIRVNMLSDTTKSTIKTTESEAPSLMQEVIKVSLYADKYDMVENVPLSEGYGSIVYRGEVDYNNAGISIAQGKAFSNAMKNLGYCLDDTEEGFKEILSFIDAYVIKSTVYNENTGNEVPIYKSIGKAIDIYNKYSNKLENELTEKVQESNINTKKESKKNPQKQELKEDVTKKVKNAVEKTEKTLSKSKDNSASIKELTNEESIEESENEINVDEVNDSTPIEELSNEESIEESENEIDVDEDDNSTSIEEVDNDEVEVDIIQIDTENDTSNQSTEPIIREPIAENIDEDTYTKALEVPFYFNDTYQNAVLRKQVDGKSIYSLLEIKGPSWFKNLLKNKHMISEETYEALKILNTKNFKI